MSSLVHIGLGSNLGDRGANLDGAITALRETPCISVRAVSRCHETTPIGGPPGQQPFLNAAAALETSLGPFELLARLQEIESRFGRVRGARWGERTLDLDLLLYGQEIIDTKALVVPHPLFSLRRFVLAPLAEISDEVDPLTGRTAKDLLDNLDRRPSLVALGGSLRDSTLRRPLSEALQAVEYRLPTPRQLLGSRYGKSACLLPPSAWGELSGLMLSGMINQFSRLPCEHESWLRSDGPSWIVTDFWIEEVLEREFPQPTETDGRSFAELRRLMRPTFVVLAAEGAQESLVDWKRFRSMQHSIGRETPVLRIPCVLESDRDESVGESLVEQILTACRATRT